jgi:hypothetical protein
MLPWLAGFTGISPAIHQALIRRWQSASAMKHNTSNDNIIIPIKLERARLWFRYALETASWLISLGLLAASAAVTGCAALFWLISGSETILSLGLAGALLLGLAGVWQLLQRLDKTARDLKNATSDGA